MGLNLKDAKLVASRASGEVWADGDGRFAFVPHNAELKQTLTERSADVAILLFELLERDFGSD